MLPLGCLVEMNTIERGILLPFMFWRNPLGSCGEEAHFVLLSTAPFIFLSLHIKINISNIYLVAYYDTPGIRWTHSRLNPRVPTGDEEDVFKIL